MKTLILVVGLLALVPRANAAGSSAELRDAVRLLGSGTLVGQNSAGAQCSLSFQVPPSGSALGGAAVVGTYTLTSNRAFLGEFDFIQGTVENSNNRGTRFITTQTFGSDTDDEGRTIPGFTSSMSLDVKVTAQSISVRMVNGRTNDCTFRR
jgi:hypothetical protein